MRGGGCKVTGGVRDFQPVAQNRVDVRMMASVATDIKVIKDGCLSEKDVKTMSAWPVWGCEPSKFPWSYGEKEIYEGLVINDVHSFNKNYHYKHLMGSKGLVLTPIGSTLPAPGCLVHRYGELLRKGPVDKRIN